MAERLRLGSTILALTVALGSCADDGTTAPASPPTRSATPAGTPSTATPTSTPTSPVPSTEAPSSPSPSPLDVLEDGRHFGYIVSIDVPTRTIVFDLAYFLTGEEANEAAAEHGDETPVPNDYYIVNDNPHLRTLAVAPDVEIRVIDWGHCCEPVEGELQPFGDAFATEHHRWDAMYQGAESQYWLTVEDGVVVRIEEQYLP
jgi:hypothetical protein